MENGTGVAEPLKGSTLCLLFDADSTQVYSGSLVASATEQSSVGTAGTWTVSIVLLNYSGTANFRVEKL
jgi:hypothetical protein